MRKKLLTFLALLTVIFALPQMAKAWSLSGTNPSDKVWLLGYGYSGATWDWDGLTMPYDTGRQDYSAEITPTQNTIYFRLHVGGNNVGGAGTLTFANWTNGFNNTTWDNNQMQVNVPAQNSSVKYLVTVRDDGDQKPKMIVTPAETYVLVENASDITSWTADTSSKMTRNGTAFTKRVTFTSTGKLKLQIKSGGVDNGWSFGPSNDSNWSGTSQTFTRTSTNGGKVWQNIPAGTYDITVEWATGTVKLEAVTMSLPSYVNMPLSPKDFANNKKHYFVVGSRMGEWHLQPEWELTLNEAGTQATLDGRYFYDGAFGIGVVDNYTDYVYQRYKLYATKYDFKDGALSCSNIPVLKENFQGLTSAAQAGRPSDDESLYSAFDNNQYHGLGAYIGRVTVNIDKANDQVSVTLTKDDNGWKTERLFSLVGDQIYNADFNNDTGKGDGTTYLRKTGSYNDNGGNGWQEGWIQFDPSGKPYIDANGMYIYQTSFTPNYMKDEENPHITHFSMLQGDDVFTYDSDNVTFVEASKLDDLANDPYAAFYNSLAGSQTIQTTSTAKTDGSTYNYTIKTVGGLLSGNWKCYVVKNMWMKGQFKIWSGWGGNDVCNYSSGSNHQAMWHGFNGGPSATLDVQGFDINSGAEVNIYKNVNNVSGQNYRINDLTYFNRVIVWYSEGNMANSFVQFIQESAGPAIEAVRSGSNNIRYTWYLQNFSNLSAADFEKKVTSYTVSRYRVLSDQDRYDGKRTVDSFNQPIKALAKAAGTITVGGSTITLTKASDIAGVTFLDNNGGEGLEAGTYMYVLEVTFDDGTKKSAPSNKVVIYDTTAAPKPQAVAVQLVKLDDAARTDLGLTGGQTYLTYRPSSNPNPVYYALSYDSNNKPINVKKVDRAKAQTLINSNPDKYLWSSDYYVRTLAVKEYEDAYARYLGDDYDDDTSIPTPSITVKEKVNDSLVTRATAEKWTDPDGVQYYSAVVPRGGNLGTSQFVVGLTIPGTSLPERTVTATIDPIMPMAYGASYKYENLPQTDKDKVPEAGTAQNVQGLENYADVLLFEVPSSVDATKKVPVYMNKADLAPRKLNCIFTFHRPNVVEDIVNYYDITYDIDIESNYTTHADGDVTVTTLEASGTWYDETTTVGTNNPLRAIYTLKLKGVHPSKDYVPTFKVKSTRYEKHVAGVDPTGLGVLAQFGSPITVKATVATTKRGGELKNIALGVATSSEKTSFKNMNPTQQVNAGWNDLVNQPGFTTDGVSFLYFGHEEFEDEGDVVVDKTNALDNTDYELVNTEENPDHFYLIETKGSGANDHASYAYLVPHRYKNTPTTTQLTIGSKTYTIHANDPLSRKWIAHNFSSTTAPMVYVTPIYIYNRLGTGVGTDQITASAEVSLKKIGQDTPAGSANPAPARRAIRKAVSKTEKLNPRSYSVKIAGDDQPNVTSFAPGGSAEGELVSVAGGSISANPGDNVTGIESVAADFDDTVEYYNLQGIRVDNPQPGQVYIVRRGATTAKELLR